MKLRPNTLSTRHNAGLMAYCIPEDAPSALRRADVAAGAAGPASRAIDRLVFNVGRYPYIRNLIRNYNAPPIVAV